MLLTESASLTARETLTVFSRSGVSVDLLDTGALTLSRLTRRRGRLVAAPAASTDPLGYLRTMIQQLEIETYDAILPTHEQATATPSTTRSSSRGTSPPSLRRSPDHPIR